MNQRLPIDPALDIEQRFLKLNPTEIYTTFTEAQSIEWFCRLRWPSTDGRPVCPYCGSVDEVIWSSDASRSQLGRLARCRRCKARPVFSARRYTMMNRSTLCYKDLLVLIFISRSRDHAEFSDMELANQFGLTPRVVKKYRPKILGLKRLAGFEAQKPSLKIIRQMMHGKSKKKKETPSLIGLSHLRQSLATLLLAGWLYKRRSQVYEQIGLRCKPRLITLKQFNLVYGELGTMKKETLQQIANIK